jgi:hypothetical protein
MQYLYKNGLNLRDALSPVLFSFVSEYTIMNVKDGL